MPDIKYFLDDKGELTLIDNDKGIGIIAQVTIQFDIKAKIPLKE